MLTKVIFSALLIALSASSASAQCPGGVCPAPWVARMATIPRAVASGLAEAVRPVAVKITRSVTKTNVLRRAPVRNAVAGLLFRPYR